MDAPVPRVQLTKKTRDLLLELGVSEETINNLKPIKPVEQFCSDQLIQPDRESASNTVNSPCPTEHQFATAIKPIGVKITDLSEPPLKKLKQEPEEKSQANLNDLPVLPFEKILGYLCLEDRIRCRAVSRR